MNFDDPPNFITNDAFHGFSLESIYWWLTSSHMGHYTPLVWVSAAVDHALWGLDPAGWHATNLLLHGLGVAGVGLLARAVLDRLDRAGLHFAPSARLMAAAAVALLWGVHPLRVESVAWITERRDVLATPLFVAAAAAWIRRGPASERPSRRGLGLVVGLATVSCFAKAWAITLPAALLAFEVGMLRHEAVAGQRWVRLRTRLVESVPLWLVSGLFSVAAATAQDASGTLKSADQFPLLERMHVVGIGLLTYPKQTLWPTDLSPLVPLSERVLWPWPAVLAGVLGTAVVLVWLARRNVWPLAAAAAYAIVLSPASGIAQSGPQLVADRYAHLSTLPWFVLLGGGLAAVWSRGNPSARRAALALCVGTGVVLAAQTWQQTATWTSSVTLWTAATRARPETRDAWFNLGVALQEAGRGSEAPVAYAQARDLGPPSPRVSYALGVSLAQQGAWTEAIDALLSVPVDDPKWGRAAWQDAARCAELAGDPVRAARLRAAAEDGADLGAIDTSSRVRSD